MWSGRREFIKKPRAANVPPCQGINQFSKSAVERVDVRNSISVAHPAPPETIGRYEIITPIASGGMGTVYAGRLVGIAGFERLVSIKVIHPHLAAKTSFIEMFLDEARLAARIHHPNVAEIHEVGEDHGIYYMVGELVLGQDLHRLIETADGQGMTIPRPVIAGLLSDVAKGLHEAHELRDEDDVPIHLVHRDISTSNILVSYKGYAKLIDFGVAWARRRLTHTRDGAQKGKIGYMPKEQLLGQPVDRRADIFALGVVLYTATVGNHPFPYDNEGEQVAKMLKGEFSSPRMVNSDIEPELEAIILKAMATEPEDRYQTAAEMEKELLVFVSQHAVGDTKKQLADLMHSLFRKEISEQNARIKIHRQRATGLDLAPQDAKPAPIEKSLIGSRHTEVLTNTDSKVIETTDTQAYGPKEKVAVAAFPVLLLVAVLIFYIGANREGRRQISTEASGAPFAASVEERSEPNVPVPQIKPVTIQFSGLHSDSIVFLNNQPTEVPIRIEPSTTPVSIRVETPGHEVFKTVLTPNFSQTLRVAQKKSSSAKKSSRPPKTKKQRAKKHSKPAPKVQPTKKETKGWLVDPNVNPYQ